MVVLIGWLLILIGVVVVLERNSKRAFYEYCKLECDDQMIIRAVNRPNSYML